MSHIVKNRTQACFTESQGSKAVSPQEEEPGTVRLSIALVFFSLSSFYLSLPLPVSFVLAADWLSLHLHALTRQKMTNPLLQSLHLCSNNQFR